MTDPSPHFPEPDAAEGGERRSTTVAPDTDGRFDVPLRGTTVGPETRCGHFQGPRDIVAIQFPCCRVFYPCYACHRETADHESERWARDAFDTPAVLCGMCQTVLPVRQYLDAEHTCPACGAAFNPGCAEHHNRYFEVC